MLLFCLRINQFLWLLPLLSISLTAKAYNLQVSISGLTNVKIHLAEYVGNSYFIIDSARTDATGNGIFSQTENAPYGIYYLVLPNKNSIEFLMTDQQDLVIETSIYSPVVSLKIHGSKESATYLHLQQFTSTQHKEIHRLKAELKNNEDLNSMYRCMKEIATIEKNIEKRRNEIIKNHPDWILSDYLRLTVDNLKSQNVNWNSTEELFYSYFKDIDFTSETIIRAPFFKDGLTHFISRYLKNSPEKVEQMTNLVVKSSFNKKVEQSILNSMYLHFNSLPDRLKGEYCMVSLAKELQQTTPVQPDLVFNWSQVNDLKNTFAGEALPHGLIKLYQQPLTYVLAVWNSDCSACYTDKTYLKQINTPVKILVLGTSEISATLRDLDTFTIAGQQQVLSNFPVFETPVYFLIEDKNRIVQKTYNIRDFL